MLQMTKCRVKDCPNQQSSGYYHDKCVQHACSQFQCTNQKHPDNKYCDKCKCCLKDCQKGHSYGSYACYEHQCDSCKKNPYSSLNDEKLCGICIKQCSDYFCKNMRVKDTKFCEMHICTIEGCFNRQYCEFSSNKMEKYCREAHLCHHCRKFRDNPDDDKYCLDCLNHCFFWACKKERPSGYKGRLYYCDDHGCLECHNTCKYSFHFLRKEISSGYCKEHYMCKKDDCEWYRISRSDFCQKHSFS